MQIIRTSFFEKQVQYLYKKYPKIKRDIFNFEKNLEFEVFSNLGSWIFKYRVKNSSIPVWKRWRFRIILKIYNNKFLFLLIYSKTQKENVSNLEIINAYEEVIKKL